MKVHVPAFPSVYPSLKQPSEEEASVSLRRYMNFGAFASFLQTRRLHFKRLDQYMDDWAEGEYPAPQTRSFKGRTPWDGSARRSTLVNCWCLDLHESNAMWKIYGDKQAVAVCTTFSKLRQALMLLPQPQPHLGIVTYINHRQDSVQLDLDDPIAPAMHKRIEFAFEREVRAVKLWHEELLHARVAMPDDARPSEISATVEADTVWSTPPMNLLTFVDEFRTSPFAEGWFHQTVEDFVKATCPQIPVLKSGMAK